MARFSVFAVAAGIATVLLPSTLARPFEHPGGRFPGHYRPLWNHETATYHTTANTLASASTSVTTSSTSVVHSSDVESPGTSATTATGVRPTGIFSSILPSSIFTLPASSDLPPSDLFSISSVASSNTPLSTSSIPFSTSLALPASSVASINTSIATAPPIPSATGIPPTGFIPSSSFRATGISSASSLSLSSIPGSSLFPPTGIIPTGLPSSSQSFLPSITGIPPTGVFPTGTAIPSGTGLATPTTPHLAAREAHLLALHKRKAFEGPRHSTFPHSWPQSASSLDWPHGKPTPVPAGSVLSFVGETTVSGSVIGGTVTIVPGVKPTGTAASCAWDMAATTGFVCIGAAGPWLGSWTPVATGTGAESWMVPTGVVGTGTGVLAVPIESGIAGPVPTSMSSSL